MEGVYRIQSALFDRYKSKHPEICSRPRAKLWGAPGLRPAAYLLVHGFFSSPPPHPFLTRGFAYRASATQTSPDTQETEEIFHFFFTPILHVGKPQPENEYHEMLSFFSQTNMYVCACMMGNSLLSSELKHLLDYINDRS